MDIKFSDFYVEIILVIVALAIASISFIIKGYVSNITMNQLREDMFKTILNKTPEKFHQKDSGEYYNYVLKKVDAWQNGFYEPFWDMLQEILELFCILFLVFHMNKMAGVVCIVFLLPLALNNIIFPQMIGKSYEEFLDQDSKMVVKLKEFLSGFDVIKFNTAEKIYADKLNRYFDKANAYNQKIRLLNNLSGSVANVCVVLSQIGGIGISFVLMLRKMIGIGEFIALIQLLSYVNEPVVKLINAVVAVAAFKNINTELKSELMTTIKQPDTNMPPVKESIEKLELNNITYQYAGKEEYVFSQFCYSFQKGGKYLIVGESGSGKSTLIKLIMGSLPLMDGEVLFDGCKMEETQRYRNIGLVPQDVFIFDDTIRNNVDILNMHTDEEVNEAIEKAQLMKFVSSKKEGIYSKINSEVLQVSGGERARIGLARALLEHKNIIIFDEILSSLDYENAYKVEEQILELENKIVLHIAHKYSKELVKRYTQVLDLSKQDNQ
jgi:ABC-type multidrug transport system fused ATPase/permease subunit